ncbi:hypothetical protein GIB67_018931, partial [Kingdonia uniflora]
YTMNEKVPPTASNRRKREFAKGDLVTYKRKIKTIDPSTVVPPNTVDTTNEGEKLPICVHHHQSTWDLTKEPQVVQDFVKLKGLDRIGAIFYNYYNSALILAFAERWQPKINSFYIKWGEMTSSLDNVEQLVGLPTDGDVTVIGGIWGFPVILESWIFAHFPKLDGIPKEMDSDAYEYCTCWKWDESITDRYGGTTLPKFREALDNYKLEDVVWDPYRDKRDFAHAFKEVTFFYGALVSPDHVQPYYPNRVMRQLNREQGIPAKRLLTETIICPITIGLAPDDNVGIHQRKEASVNEYGDTPVHQSKDVAEQYDASHHEYASLSPNSHGTMQTRGGSGGFDHQITTLNDQLQKLKEDKEKDSEANINLREALKEKDNYTYL